jgi:thiol-disulfide isomerase/thioredoxin
VALLALLPACPAKPVPASEKDRGEAAAEPTPAAEAERRGPEFVPAPEAGEVAELVRAELERAEADGRTLLIYVGATWCEPCRYFHEAVDHGELDEVFPELRLLEFDLDRDRDRLAAAGYVSRMIPLFVAPAPDGLAGPRRTEGGIKGPGAVEHIRPRLEGLLDAARADH